jgi:NADP-dependent 3-hydroxy acid dehydrogenase YdfG
MTGQPALIVGSSSGIGAAPTRMLGDRGSTPGLTARRTDRLDAIGADLPTETRVAHMDVTETAAARDTVEAIVADLQGADVVVLNAGVAPISSGRRTATPPT